MLSLPSHHARLLRLENSQLQTTQTLATSAQRITRSALETTTSIDTVLGYELVRIRARASAGPEEFRSRIPALAAAYGKAHPKI
jgi:hypothetical protein